MIGDVLKYLAGDADAALGRLHEFLSIPSVSTDPAYADPTTRAARWASDQLQGCGLDTRVYPTQGHPIVVAKTPPHAAPPTAPTVLFYGHYDVQPPDPIEAWTTPPFEPTVRDGAIHARGASDDKGQVACFMEALRAWMCVSQAGFAPSGNASGGFGASGGGGTSGGWLPVHVTVLLEGEEECGSVQLAPFVQSHRDELKADVAVISDTTMWPTPAGPRVAITYSLRGLLYFDIQLHHANRDLHSGVFGGTLANPATVLTGVLGGLFDDKHRVTVPGFYDAVVPPTEAERRRWSDLPFDETDFFAQVGVRQPHGEAGYPTLERRWARPSCDINGLYGGYSGAGAKTIIPSFAGAKVSFRLAPDQDPDRITALFTQWLHSQDVHGCRWQIQELGRAHPVLVPTDSPWVAAAHRAIRHSTGSESLMIREGATIPIVSDLKNILGLDSLLIGFGLADDRIHAPNEKFNLDCFRLGCQTHAVLLAELGRVAKQS